MNNKIMAPLHLPSLPTNLFLPVVAACVLLCQPPSRVIWASEDPAAYKNLKYSLLTHITDTLQPADAYHAALKKAQAAAAQQWLQQHKARPEVAAALKAAKEGLVGAPARAAVTDTAVAVPTAGSTVGQTAGQ